MARGFIRLASLVGVAVAALTLVAASSGTTTKLGAQAKAASGVAPKATSEVDCNGLSAKHPASKPMMRALCADPRSVDPGDPGRFEDNGRYIGHDEPSTKFISSTPGSG